MKGLCSLSLSLSLSFSPAVALVLICDFLILWDPVEEYTEYREK